MTPAPPGEAPAAPPGPARERSGLQDRRGLDLALALGALGLAALSAALISADLRAPIVSAERQVGVLISSAGGARRRLSGSLVWDELRPGDALFERDSIFVPPRGTTTLELADGARVEVAERTLMVLERPRAVSLKKGSAAGAAWGWQARARSERAGRPPGQVSAAGAGGEIRDAVTLISPAPNERRYYRGQIPTIPLKLENAPGLVVQVAQDRLFTQVLRQAAVVDGQYPVVMDRPGLYWWRAIGADGQPRSHARKFALEEDGPPILISPRPGGRAPPGSVPFSWGPLQGVDRYRLQVSPEPEFTATTLDVEVEGTRFRWATGDTPEGAYFWRVRAISQERAEAPFTDSRQMHLLARPPSAVQQTGRRGAGE